MVKTKLSILVRISPVLALWSCATPAPPAAEETAPTPVEKKATTPAAEPDPVALDLPPDEGFRFPGMLDLPGDAEFRAAAPASPGLPSGSGAVIARPPTDPPSRPKPKEEETTDEG